MIKKDELVLLYISKETWGMSFRKMHEVPVKEEQEIFMAILEFKDACIICNRYNNEVWKKGDK